TGNCWSIWRSLNSRCATSYSADRWFTRSYSFWPSWSERPAPWDRLSIAPAPGTAPLFLSTLPLDRSSHASRANIGGGFSAIPRRSVHLPKVRAVNRSLRPSGRSRIAVRFRDGRPCGDRYEHRHHKNRGEGHEDRVRGHVPLLGSDSEVGLYRQVEETSVMPVTLWSYRRKL